MLICVMHILHIFTIHEQVLLFTCNVPMHIHHEQILLIKTYVKKKQKHESQNNKFTPKKVLKQKVLNKEKGLI